MDVVACELIDGPWLESSLHWPTPDGTSSSTTSTSTTTTDGVSATSPFLHDDCTFSTIGTSPQRTYANPFHIHNHKQPLISPWGNGGGDSHDALDELQARHTTLCFLCSVNADAGRVVGLYLAAHPSALLLEGTGTVPEESARSILESQARKCRCGDRSPCAFNRIRLATLLDHGFEHHCRRGQLHAHGFGRPAAPHQYPDPASSNVYGPRLRALERDIREWRLQELLLRNRLLGAALRVRALHRDLERVEGAASPETTDPHDAPSSISLVRWTAGCARSLRGDPTPAGSPEIFARQSVLHCQLGLAHRAWADDEREHRQLLRKIRSARRLQFGLLKTAFDGCLRHVCHAGRYEDDSGSP